MLTALRSGAADVTVGSVRLSADALAGAVGAVAQRVAGLSRVAVVADSTMQAVVAVAGVLMAGGCAVPVNPQSGATERARLLTDASPDLVLTSTDVDLDERAQLPGRAVPDDAPALLIYTSGTTGAPKGVVLSERAVCACLDGLAAAWSWTADDVLAHALPLFHVHGLVLGCLGALRHGSRLVVTPRFGPVPGASIYFAVPTMWSRLEDADLSAMAPARLLVSGSAALPAPVFDRVRNASGHRLVERYGLTESLIVTAARPDEARSAGHVGRPLTDVRLRIDQPDDSGMGEVLVAGPTLFSGYRNQPDATAATMTAEGWLRTGDLGVVHADGGLRLLGRLATDLIKTGGYKVGAGEVEDALLAHPAVAEAAVTGEPDDDLGQRIVAWVVVHESVPAQTLVDHVARDLAPHKRPRDIRFVDALPRNAMGKVQKRLLG
ncbi:MAG: malonyl-CoA/methylmalonyl-CoA synthetase [Frankiaceae bacterium]|nr:malonyl-CoA/methylmalonyl-CoA synthetase [Frankiaceae bacterium]